LGLNGGVTLPNDAEYTARANHTFETTYHAGYFVSGAVGYKWPTGFRLEAEISYSEFDFGEVSSARITPQAGNAIVGRNLPVRGDTDVLAIMANAGFEFPVVSDIALFAFAGVGGARINLSDVTVAGLLLIDTFVWIPAFQTGGGISYALNDRWAVNLGYRYFFTTEFHVTDVNRGPAIFAFGTELSSHIVTLGVRYAF
jgi:opacity protein-like surface antigen